MSDHFYSVKRAGPLTQSIVALSALTLVTVGIYARYFSGSEINFVDGALIDLLLVLGSLMLACTMGGLTAIMFEMQALYTVVSELRSNPFTFF